MTKKKTVRVRKRPNRVPLPIAATDAGEAIRAITPAAEPARPATFGLIFTHVECGKIVLGVQGPSFTIFRNKTDAAEWLRGLARSIEVSRPEY